MEMHMKIIAPLSAALLGLAALHAGAQATPEVATKPPKARLAAQPAATLTDGEVRKVDKSNGKVTIKHGPITNLDMPPMTMVFRVSQAALLDQLKAGDKIRFAAEKVDGALTITRVE